ncbi:hypothetical protein HY642_03060 [Candidatus Woesearchaeota archaeon]|nr:hypothetical protein [Candidatus Woesearchaeota archaeon]
MSERVVLAHDLSQEQSREFFPAYDAIGRGCDAAGKGCFIPYRTFGIANDGLSREWPPHAIYALMNGEKIPAANLVIAFLGLPSMDVGAMVGCAKTWCKPIIEVHPAGETPQQVREIQSFYAPLKVIAYTSIGDLEICVEDEVRRFFARG